ncbi:pentatricopeptide repeat domain-containing protein 3, mitochondrial-like, partial [Actinia tenebrosa]|uniref:Small ribosomal subunit protein mS39 n=1 Tax=Actinia tenebrosa TaxID=6105 RepID=A0A6P8H5W8_ACTTE
GEKSTKSYFIFRDPLAVLKVLAGTVQPTALAPPRELFEDFGLYPKSPRKREECKIARTSGLKAADFILHKYPQLFPMRKAEPGWPDMNQGGAIETEQDLKDIIAEMKAQEAITGYEKLLKDGVPVSLQTRNDLLDLVAYYGTISAAEPVDTVKSGSLEGESSSSESSDESSSDEEEVENVRHKRTWSMDNYAEKLFKSMEDKNSRSYDAMILALLKHNYYERAFELFEHMREQNFQEFLFLYCILPSRKGDLSMYGFADGGKPDNSVKPSNQWRSQTESSYLHMMDPGIKPEIPRGKEV